MRKSRNVREELIPYIENPAEMKKRQEFEEEMNWKEKPVQYKLVEVPVERQSKWQTHQHRNNFARLNSAPRGVRCYGERRVNESQ